MKDETLEKNASTGDEKGDEQKTEENGDMTPSWKAEKAVPLERSDSWEASKRRTAMISRILEASDQDLNDDDDDEQFARDRSSKSSSSNSQEKMQHSSGRMSMINSSRSRNSNKESLRASYLESRSGKIRRKDSKDSQNSLENKKTAKELGAVSKTEAVHCDNAIAASAAAGEHNGGRLHDLSLLRKSKISPPVPTMPTNLPEPLPLGENSHEFACAEQKNAKEAPAGDKRKDSNGEKGGLLLGAREAKCSSSIQSQGMNEVQQQVPGAHAMPGINSLSHSNSSSNDIETNIANGSSPDAHSTNMGDENVGNDESLPVPPPPQLIANQRYTAPGMFSMGNDMVRANGNADADADDLEQPQQGDATSDGDSIEKDLLVEATLVSPESSRAFGLPRLISNAGILVEATPVTMIGSNKLLLAGLCASILIIVVLGVTLGLRKEDVSIIEGEFLPSAMPSASPTETFVPTLERVRQAGVLRCGQEAFLPELFQFFESLQNPPPELQELIDKTKKYNFDRALCRAIAAAILGDDAQFEMHNASEANKYRMLKEDQAHVLISKVFQNLEADVYESSVDEGISFSIPFLVSGWAFVGKPEFVACAEDDIKTFFNCSDIRICVESGSAFQRTLRNRIPHRLIVDIQSPQDMVGSFMSNECNVGVTEGYMNVEPFIRFVGYRGDFEVGDREYTRELAALATLDEDTEWSDFVNAVLMGLLEAEKRGITQATSETFGETNLFGDLYSRMFIDAIKSGGNLGEIYDREAAHLIPRGTRNRLNNGTTGLLLSHPFGNKSDQGFLPPSNRGTLELLLDRHVMTCGVRPNRSGFAFYDGKSMAGMDVDICNAVGSSLFEGRTELVQFVNITSSADGYRMLQNGTIDVFAGAVWSIQDDVREVTTGEGFSFSRPYFYGPVDWENASFTFDENLALATRQDDPRFSSFVYWVTDYLVYAEENDITQRVSSKMPLVNNFGPNFARMFRDSVHAVGNYGEIYERNLEATGILPRGGRNTIATVEDAGALHYVPPGW